MPWGGENNKSHDWLLKVETSNWETHTSHRMAAYQETTAGPYEVEPNWVLVFLAVAQSPRKPMRWRNIYKFTIDFKINLC
jgi:hypothetical protein